MKKNEIVVRFSELADTALSINARTKDKRFYPMTDGRNGKLIDFGMYDYTTKRYVLSNIHAANAKSALVEIEKMITRR